MTVFRPDTTFPYLKVAREHGVPYGDVLRFIEDFDRDAPGPLGLAMAPTWMADAGWAWYREQERRREAN